MSIDADVGGVFIAACSIDDLPTVAVIKSLTFGHAIQFTLIWRPQVRHPLVIATLEGNTIETGTLPRPEVGRFRFIRQWALLRVAGTMSLEGSDAAQSIFSPALETFPGLGEDATSAGPRTGTFRRPVGPDSGFDDVLLLHDTHSVDVVDADEVGHDVTARSLLLSIDGDHQQQQRQQQPASVAGRYRHPPGDGER